MKKLKNYLITAILVVIAVIGVGAEIAAYAIWYGVLYLIDTIEYGIALIKLRIKAARYVQSWRESNYQFKKSHE